MADDDLLVEISDGIATATFNRPERLNALDSRLMQETLPGLWPRLEADPDVRVVILTGAGTRAFSAGLDVKEAARTPPAYRGPTAGRREMSPRAQRFSKPLISAVNGLCGGVGLVFIADADVSIAAEHAYLFNPGVTIGQLATYAAVTWTRSIPFQAVMRMLLVGNRERIPAARALELGMLNEVVPSEQLQPRAREVAEMIAANSPTAVRYAKRILWESLDRGLDEAHRHTQEIMAEYSGHPDMSEGPRALVEKRAPRWQDPGESGGGE